MLPAERGFSLIEIAVTMTVAVFLLAVGGPSFVTWAAGLRVELAAGEVLGVFNLARITAARLHTKVGVRFRTQQDGSVTYALFRDGDGDGLRNRDIDAGVDTELRSPRRLAHFDSRVFLGFPAGIQPTDPGNPRRQLDRLEDPIRFNKSDLAVFSPNGTATPGTVYLTGGPGTLAAVRVNNRSGKVSVLFYEEESGLWK